LNPHSLAVLKLLPKFKLDLVPQVPEFK